VVRRVASFVDRSNRVEEVGVAEAHAFRVRESVRDVDVGGLLDTTLRLLVSTNERTRTLTGLRKVSRPDLPTRRVGILLPPLGISFRSKKNLGKGKAEAGANSRRVSTELSPTSKSAIGVACHISSAMNPDPDAKPAGPERASLT